jgi:Mrp family chromosome partitioning ATPase
MGRMLESLRHVTKPLAEQDVVEWTSREPEEVPFIEVGGSGKKMEGSAQVMAIKHPAGTAVQPPHLPTEKNLASAQKTIILTQPKAMSVVFEAWPGSLGPTRGIAPELIAYYQPTHAISKQYTSLLGKILEGQNAQGSLAILLSGSKPSVGTSTALLNLAIVAAVQDKRRLVLVDAHLLRPSLAQRLGLSADAGLQEVLTGNAALETTVLKTPIPGMCLLAARADDNSATGHLSPQALAWVLCWLKERFDLVLVDGPTLGENAEIAPLAPLCDGMYLVVPQNESAPLERAMTQTISKQGGRLKGLIHTQFE